MSRIPPHGGEPELLVDKAEFSGPNGLCFSPGQDLLYVDDPDRGDVKVSGRVADGKLAERTLSTAGRPRTTGGSMAWSVTSSATSGPRRPGGISVLDPSGARIGVIATPEPLGSLVWGGDDLRLLFLASSTSIHTLETRVAGARPPATT